MRKKLNKKWRIAFNECKILVEDDDVKEVEEEEEKKKKEKDKRCIIN